MINVQNNRDNSIDNLYSTNDVLADNSSSIGEILPSYSTQSVIKYYYEDNGQIKPIEGSKYYPNVMVSGWSGQEFKIGDIQSYKKVVPGFYLTNPDDIEGTFSGTISEYQVGNYYRKVYYNSDGTEQFFGVYHQIDPNGTMKVSAYDPDGRQIGGESQIIKPGGSTKFKIDSRTTWTARNPYVTSSAHEVQLKYAKLGSVIFVDENGNQIGDATQYDNDPNDPSKAISPYEKAPDIPGYVAVNPDETIVLPDNLSLNTYIKYRMNATVNYKGEDSKTYDGKSGTINLDKLSWSMQPAGNELDLGDLKPTDFTWLDKDGNEISAPTDAGTYQIKLNSHGEDLLKDNNKNYNITKIDGTFTYTITPAAVKEGITYSGSDSKTYDGKPATFNVKDVEWKGLEGLNTSTLTAADFTWNTADNQAPTAAGDYTLSLTKDGEAALRAANPNYDLQTISGSYTYTITPLTVVAVNHKGYDKKVYDGQPGVINLDKLVWDELPDGTNLNLNGLTSAYFSWDTPNHEAPTEVGRYTISLTKQGEDLLQAENPNYNFSKFTGTFIYDITPITDVTVTYNGADGKTYDGQPGTINPDKLTWSKLPDGTSLKMPTWSADDFAWDTADGLAPTAVGTYQIILTDAGKAALQKANPNYDLSNINGVFTYEIKPAQTPETPGQTPEQQPGQTPETPGQTPEQQPGQNTNQSGTPGNGFGPSARPNASTNSNASQLPQTGNDHSNTALAGLALASLTAMFGLGKKRKHD